MIEDMLRRYLAWLEIRREVAEISRDDAGWWEARAAERDAEKALEMVRSGEW